MLLRVGKSVNVLVRAIGKLSVSSRAASVNVKRNKRDMNVSHGTRQVREGRERPLRPYYTRRRRGALMTLTAQLTGGV